MQETKVKRGREKREKRKKKESILAPVPFGWIATGMYSMHAWACQIDTTEGASAQAANPQWQYDDVRQRKKGRERERSQPCETCTVLELQLASRVSCDSWDLYGATVYQVNLPGLVFTR